MGRRRWLAPCDANDKKTGQRCYRRPFSLYRVAFGLAAGQFDFPDDEPRLGEMHSCDEMLVDES